MVVITGPFDFLTTSRSPDIWPAGFGGSAAGAGAADSFFSAGEQPVMTAAAPRTAERIMNVRRSTPAGSCS